ncbi:MAG TPA: biopolymer transporter ExbD [Pirellulaceae bacterium]|nr:biopolymer transporter ExbD [Pirellulaceae bacterium]
MGFKLKRTPRESAEMDITPMIDCTFLLLIFFVLTSTMENKTLDLPKAKHGAAAVEQNCVIIVIGGGGDSPAKVYLASSADEDQLATGSAEDQEKAVAQYVIREARAHPEKKAVLIKAAAGVKHRDVARIAKAAATVEDVTVQELYMGVTQEKQ